MVSKSSFFHVVIEMFDKLNNKLITLDSLVDYLSKNETIVYWAFILHDKDIDDNGVSERNHYHLHIQLVDKYSKTTLLNDIASKLFINKNIISIRRVKDVVRSVQYLLHQNDVDKYQYDLLDLCTNDFNETLSILKNGVSIYDVDIDYLIELVKCSRNIGQIYKQLGMKKVTRYRAIVKDLWNERNLL